MKPASDSRLFQVRQEVHRGSLAQNLFALESLKETTMKKVFAPLLVPLFAFVLFACGSAPIDPATSSTAPAVSTPDSSQTPDVPETPDTNGPTYSPEVQALISDPVNEIPNPDSSEDANTLNAQAVVPSTAFVNPYTGLDTNLGTAAKPWKTIRRALTGAKAGLTILLSRGVYSATRGETYGYVVPNGVTIKGATTGVVLEGNTLRYGFNFQSSGSLQNLIFTFFTAPVFVTARTKGVVTLSGLAFIGTDGLAINHTSPSEVRVTNCTFSGPLTTAIRLSGAQDGTRRPKLVVQGGNITGAVTGIHSRFADVTINGLVTNISSKSSLFMDRGSTAVVTGAKFLTRNLTSDIFTIGKGNKLKVRSSQFSGDSAVGAGGNFFEIDLGKSSADPGKNDFTHTFIAIQVNNEFLTSARTVFAVGNRWKPNVQGSDASGKFIGFRPVCPSSSISGKNFNLYVTPGAPQLCLVL